VWYAKKKKKKKKKENKNIYEERIHTFACINKATYSTFLVMVK
jgi:ribosomal protein L20